ncbi:hypothetical protein MPER_04051, partial [Moniliophthora perniciosa FA553]
MYPPGMMPPPGYPHIMPPPPGYPPYPVPGHPAYNPHIHPAFQPPGTYAPLTHPPLPSQLSGSSEQAESTRAVLTEIVGQDPKANDMSSTQ